MPAFRKYNITPGDHIYPVHVHKGTMYILGCMRVKVIESIEEYILERPETFGACDASTASYVFFSWINDHPDQHYLCPTCCTEVAVGDEGTEIGLDVPVPTDQTRNRWNDHFRGQHFRTYAAPYQCQRCNICLAL